MSKPMVASFVQVNASITIDIDDNGTSETIQLTRALLTGKSSGSKLLPFLCVNFKIDAKQIAKLPYEQRLNVFFDRAIMSKPIYLRPTTQTLDEITAFNFANMLVLLFPTSIPVIDNIMVSGNTPLPSVVSWTDTSSRMVPYSYLYTNGKILTITNTVWINDVRNNPRYSEFISKLRIFMEWRNRIIISAESISEETKLINLLLDSSSNGLGLAVTNSENIDRKSTSITNSYNNFNNYITGINTAISEIKKDTSPETYKQNVKIILDNMRSIKNLEKTLSGPAIRANDYINLLSAIQEIKKYLNVFALVEQQQYALQVITQINIQYASNPDMAAYINATYPQYTQFAEVVRAFYKLYQVDNPLWSKRIDKLFQSSVTNQDTGDSGQKMINELIAMATNELPQKEGVIVMNQQWVGFDTIKDTKTTTDVRTIIIDLQMDVIDSKVDNDNIGAITCAYRDVLLGAKFDQLFVPENYSWRLPPRLFFAATSLIENAKRENNKPKPEPADKPPPVPNKTQKRGGYHRRQHTLRAQL